MSVEAEAMAEAKRRRGNLRAWPRASFAEGYEYGFHRGAAWAVERVTVEQIAEVLNSREVYERDPHGPGWMLARGKAATAIAALYKGEGGGGDV